MDVEVLIPTWNRADLLRRTLRALERQTVMPSICVVDNGSDDITVPMLRREYPEVRLEVLPENLGFGRAVNAGLDGGRSRLVILLNNDTVPEPDFVERLLGVQRSSGAEMVAACLRSPDGRIDSLGLLADRSLIVYDLLHGESYSPMPQPVPEPLAPCGGAGLYLRRALEDVGGFDEDFFAYLEDLDVGIRLRLAGAKCAAAPAAVAWHEHSATLGSGSFEKNRLLAHSRSTLVFKYGANLRRSDRVRGAIVEGATAVAKSVRDRNVGALSGRLRARRSLRLRARPAPDQRWERVPIAAVSTRRALALKAHRGMRYRSLSTGRG